MRIRPFGILIGLLLVGSAAYVLFALLPSVDPRQVEFTQRGLFREAAEVGFAGKQYLRPEAIDRIAFIAWIVLGVGVFQLLIGSVRRVDRAGYCESCKRQVNVRRGFFGWTCERCRRRTKVN